MQSEEKGCAFLRPWAHAHGNVLAGPTSAAQPLIVSATLRSRGVAIGALCVALFWNGLLSIFVTHTVGGLYTKLIGPLPSWFPTPTVSSNGGPHLTGPQQSMGELLFECLFLTPFLLVGALFIGAFLTFVFGSVRVIVAGDRARIRTGIGPLSFGKRFDPLQVKHVAIGATSWKENDKSKPQIVLTADTEVRFGSSLTNDRRAWMVATLRSLLVTPRR